MLLNVEVDATFGELLTVLSKIDYLLGYGEAAIAPESRPGNLLLAHKRSKVGNTVALGRKGPL